MMMHGSHLLLQPAPQATQGAVAEDRATDFVAVDPGTEHYSGPKLVVIAYLAIWVVLMAWILVLWRKSGSMANRLEGLEQAIDRAAGAAEAKRADDKKAKAKASS